ncbi:hypothetical protein [Sinomonas atrocyanea]|uniref:hypothetical protein n=1 Tax=Sinomonas atrocyanea TaxID=37927 RepID=UPI00286A3695|nr:hypothetical protein [Sinomonas atrocyanea]
MNNYVLVFGHMGEQAKRSVLLEVEADVAGLYIDGTWVRKPSKRLPDPVLSLMGFEHLVAALEGYQPSSAANLLTPSSKAPTQAFPPVAHPDIF